MCFKLFIGCVVFHLFFISCDSWLGIRITDETQIERFCEKMNKVITPDMQVSQITLISSQGKLNEIMSSATVTYTTANSDKFRTMTVDLSNGKTLNDKEVNYTYKATTKSFAKLNFSNIPSVIHEAAGQLNQNDLDLGGISSFCIKFTSDTTFVYEFDVYGKSRATKSKTEQIGGTRKSRKYRTYYFCRQVSFTYSGKDIYLNNMGKFKWVY